MGIRWRLQQLDMANKTANVGTKRKLRWLIQELNQVLSQVLLRAELRSCGPTGAIARASPSELLVALRRTADGRESGA